MSNSLFSPIKLRLLSQFLHKKGQVLDVGCGRLHYARWMREQFPEVNIVALDLLSQESENRIAYRTVDLEVGTEMPSESCQSVVVFDVIEHIAREDFFVAELARVLAPGGVLVGSVPHDVDGFLPAYNLTFFHRSDVTHKRYYTLESLCAVLEKAGFVSVQISPDGGISPHVIAEFFPAWSRWVVKKMVSVGLRLGLLSNGDLKSDLFFVAYKKE